MPRVSKKKGGKKSVKRERIGSVKKRRSVKKVASKRKRTIRFSFGDEERAKKMQEQLDELKKSAEELRDQAMLAEELYNKYLQMYISANDKIIYLTDKFDNISVPPYITNKKDFQLHNTHPYDAEMRQYYISLIDRNELANYIEKINRNNILGFSKEDLEFLNLLHRNSSFFRPVQDNGVTNRLGWSLFNKFKEYWLNEDGQILADFIKLKQDLLESHKELERIVKEYSDKVKSARIEYAYPISKDIHGNRISPEMVWKSFHKKADEAVSLYVKKKNEYDVFLNKASSASLGDLANLIRANQQNSEQMLEIINGRLKNLQMNNIRV